MSQITLTITDHSKEKFFMELLQQLDFVEVVKEKKAAPKKNIKLTKKQQAFVKGLKQALHEVELHQQGKIKLKTLDELIQEL